jgi:hypothetical protein
MAGTLITFFRWSLVRTSSFFLVLVWAFNPLGSQASFRGVYLRERNGIDEGNVTYFNPDLIAGLQSTSTFEPLVRPLYTAVFYDTVSRTQYANHESQTYRDLISSLGGQSAAGIRAAMDPWGNIRIPHLEYMDNYNESDPHRRSFGRREPKNRRQHDIQHYFVLSIFQRTLKSSLRSA